MNQEHLDRLVDAAKAIVVLSIAGVCIWLLAKAL